ncbi:hypothetical protein V8J88_08295 [Massilia sp. W12]|uniref:hypothetical protein n=1 Tax=Massilia sp. W12 TaxID=3126507 RepID=UPI0030D0A912
MVKGVVRFGKCLISLLRFVLACAFEGLQGLRELLCGLALDLCGGVEQRIALGAGFAGAFCFGAMPQGGKHLVEGFDIFSHFVLVAVLLPVFVFIGKSRCVDTEGGKGKAGAKQGFHYFPFKQNIMISPAQYAQHSHGFCKAWRNLLRKTQGACRFGRQMWFFCREPFFTGRHPGAVLRPL